MRASIGSLIATAAPLTTCGSSPATTVSAIPTAENGPQSFEDSSISHVSPMFWVKTSIGLISTRPPSSSNGARPKERSQRGSRPRRNE